ncbi:hypothetical protein [uncultured Polaribacter sp.]|uniref:hypothetical protein n=1 Tax=uncultured Polaribacter sp. TaxID=174711 RepID=UPI00260F68DC|nr:hypothetical protein [uncultured Polaribacter sp.]
MKKHNIFLLLIGLSVWVHAQENIINSDFAIRDFSIQKDSIYFIEKRDVKSYNFKTNKITKDGYFIGGYGLHIFNDIKNDQIITISNEFERTISSLRFYNKKSKKVENVFYYKKGKAIKALIIKENKIAILSMNNNKIIIVDYSAKPVFKILHNISLKALARDFYFKDNSLFYATDLGNIYKYNLKTKKNKLIVSYGEVITNLNIYNNTIVFSTINGAIVKYNTFNNNVLQTEIKNNFILCTFLLDNKLICGTFNGSIIVLSLDKMKIVTEFNYHNRSVLKIAKGTNNDFYSSSIDKTFKKWKIE